MIGHQPLELLAGVLAAAIGVMQQRIGLAPSSDCHYQGIGDERRRHRSAHRPADNTPGEEIDDGRHIEPAFRRPDEVKSAIHLRLGAGASKLRSSTLGATAAAVADAL